MQREGAASAALFHSADEIAAKVKLTHLSSFEANLHSE
jgi:hypothetical protein